jgi:hypothetical protein
LIAWFVLSEIVTFQWYASHESKLTRNVIPADGADVMKRLKAFAVGSGAVIKDQDIGSTAMEMLKCAYGKTLIWGGTAGSAAATVLKWSEDSVVGGVETLHNPGICLSAAGWKIGKETALGMEKFGGTYCRVTEWEVSRNGTEMRAFSAVVRRFAESKEADAGKYRNSERLESVLQGRRDAPVLILLVYVPVGSSEADTKAQFREVMEAALGGSEPVAVGG